MKLAAIESEWNTHPAPASFTLIGIPDQENERTVLMTPYRESQRCSGPSVL
jgi:cytochrome d ubiquinol oxidase subunit I